MKSKIKGVSRIDQESTRTHGWFVRVGYRLIRGTYKPTHTKFFGDVGHGGKLAARLAAETFVASVTRHVAGKKAPAKPARRHRAIGFKKAARQQGAVRRRAGWAS